MDEGRLVEMAPPAELLAKQGGAFSSMVRALGPEAAATIHAKAAATAKRAAAEKKKASAAAATAGEGAENGAKVAPMEITAAANL